MFEGKVLRNKLSSINLLKGKYFLVKNIFILRFDFIEYWVFFCVLSFLVILVYWDEK